MELTPKAFPGVPSTAARLCFAVSVLPARCSITALQPRGAGALRRLLRVPPREPAGDARGCRGRQHWRCGVPDMVKAALKSAHRLHAADIVARKSILTLALKVRSWTNIGPIGAICRDDGNFHGPESDQHWTLKTALLPRVVVGGGVSVGQCLRGALPCNPSIDLRGGHRLDPLHVVPNLPQRFVSLTSRVGSAEVSA